MRVALRHTSNFGIGIIIVSETKSLGMMQLHKSSRHPLSHKFYLRSELFQMKSIKLTFGLTALGLGFASAASNYSVDLKKPVTVGSTQLQPGQYKVEIQGDKATFKMGKNVVEVPATLGKSDQKYGTTGIVTDGAKLVEIDLGGTTEKILFSPKAGESAGGGN